MSACNPVSPAGIVPVGEQVVICPAPTLVQSTTEPKVLTRVPVASQGWKRGILHATWDSAVLMGWNLRWIAPDGNRWQPLAGGTGVATGANVWLAEWCWEFEVTLTLAVPGDVAVTWSYHRVG